MDVQSTYTDITGFLVENQLKWCKKILDEEELRTYLLKEQGNGMKKKSGKYFAIMMQMKSSN
jgi:hypothetical protein